MSDADHDGLCDSWELQGLEPGGGHANWIPPGATPVHKDLYVTIGGLQGSSPNPAAIADVVGALTLAPSESLATPNLDHLPGITLHASYGDTTLTPMVLRWPFWASFDSLKALSFVSSAERSQYGTEFLATKDRVSRFCLFADRLLDGAGEPRTGKAKNVPCRDFIVALGEAEFLRDKVTKGGTRHQQSSTFMHELGHSIGLRHGGGDDNQYKPNYRSVMSYIWQLPNALLDPYWKLTYSQRPFNRLVKSNVNETQGIGGTPGDQVFVTWFVNNKKSQHRVPEAGATDLNGQNGIETSASCPYLDAPTDQPY